MVKCKLLILSALCKACTMLSYLITVEEFGGHSNNLIKWSGEKEYICNENGLNFNLL